MTIVTYLLFLTEIKKETPCHLALVLEITFIPINYDKRNQSTKSTK